MEGVNCGNAGGVPHQLGAGAGGSAPAVDGDKIRLGIDAEFQIPLNAAGGNLDADGPAVGGHPQLLHQSLQILPAVNPREA